MIDIKVHGTDDISEEEKQAYVNYMQKKYPDIKSGTLDILIDGDYVDLDFSPDAVPFQRIRRITGYLVGTLDRFNDAKRAEVNDRVKHGIRK